MKKLAIVSSHPIQYYAPLFRLLSKEIELKVFYCHNPSPEEIGKDGFGKAFQWDVDLLKGYNYEFLKNQSKSPSLSSYNGCDTPQIGTALKKYGATHVVLFGWYLKSLVQALKYCNKNKVPVAARGDSQLNPQLPIWKKLLKKLYYPFFLGKYDAFLFVGKRNRKYLEHYGVSKDKLIFSPHAVDQDFWKPTDNNGASPVFSFVWAGKFSDKKRPWEVLKAFKDTFANKENIVLNMIGSGEHHDQLVEQYSQLVNIRFLGFKNQTGLREIFGKSDCLVLSSDYGETWGLVVNEAMSCGVPTIVSSACGCSEDMVDNCKTGYIYDFSSVDDLKKAMLMAVTKDKSFYKEELEKKNQIYSYNRNMQAFKEFMQMPNKSLNK